MFNLFDVHNSSLLFMLFDFYLLLMIDDGLVVMFEFLLLMFDVWGVYVLCV